MAIQERGLGRGLDVLFRNSSTNGTTNVTSNEKHQEELLLPAITKLPVAILHPTKEQPRKSFDTSALEELAASIQSQGVVQPILVRPCKGDVSVSYEIVAGERRWRAAKMAGLVDIPVYIKELSDDDVMTVALVENLQREDLNPIEEALAMQSLWEKLSISQDELARRLGKSRSAVANTLRLLQLSSEVQESICRYDITPGHARALLALPDNDLRQTLYAVIVKRQLSVRDVEAAVIYWKRNGILPTAITGMAINKKKESKKVKIEFIKKILEQLRTNIHPKVTMVGTESMGRITIPYESQEQLKKFLQKINILFSKD